MTENREQLRLIALRIRDLRDISGLSAQEVASRAGIDEDEYLAYETGERDFSFSHLFNIAEVLGVDISDLLTGEKMCIRDSLTRMNVPPLPVQAEHNSTPIVHHLSSFVQSRGLRGRSYKIGLRLNPCQKAASS